MNYAADFELTVELRGGSARQQLRRMRNAMSRMRGEILRIQRQLKAPTPQFLIKLFVSQAKVAELNKTFFSNLKLAQEKLGAAIGEQVNGDARSKFVEAFKIAFTQDLNSYQTLLKFSKRGDITSVMKRQFEAAMRKTDSTIRHEINKSTTGQLKNDLLKTFDEELTIRKKV
jgi:hypothetical protein